jgi:preprotein translocase subunit SecY
MRQKLLFTLFILLLYRMGAAVRIPFVSADTVDILTNLQSGGNIFEYLNVLSGDAFARATLFALSISPYITASIVMQLLAIAIPPLERLSKDGENGRKKITAITRVVTVALALVTSIGYALFLANNDLLVLDKPNFFQYAIIVACYCAGAALVMWLAEKINDHGIGNGISIILFANIIAGFYSMFQSIWDLATNDKLHLAVGISLAVLEVAVLIGMIMLIVWMSDAERRIPIQYAKRVVGRKMYGGQNTNLPIKVNMSGVMPIIFANSIVAIPATIASFMNKENWFTKFVNNVFNYNTWPYLIVFLILLISPTVFNF